MNLYITQNSYYFVHRHFIKYFLKQDSEIIFVTEKERGILKKYIEIIFNFGILETIKYTFLEVLYLVIMYGKVSKIKISKITDRNLNVLLEKKIKYNSYEKIISIGCPTRIDATLQKKYNIKIFNLHGGILPYQKGRFSPIKSLNNEHSYLGASIHEVSNSFDEGEIISQNYFKINNHKKIENYNKVLQASSKLLGLFLADKYVKIPNKVLISLKK